MTSTSLFTTNAKQIEDLSVEDKTLQLNGDNIDSCLYIRDRERLNRYKKTLITKEKTDKLKCTVKSKTFVHQKIPLREGKEQGIKQEKIFVIHEMKIYKEFP